MTTRLLGTLGVHDNLIVHMNLIEWMLDPQGWHGWKDLLLRRFVEDIVKREFHSTSSHEFPTTGWHKASMQRDVRVGKGEVELLIRHPKGMTIGISTEEPRGLSVKELHSYWRGLSRKHGPMVMMYLKPWYELKEYTKPKYRLSGWDNLKLTSASCGTLYLSWVAERAIQETKSQSAKRGAPLAFPLLEEFSRILSQRARRERHKDHA